MLLYKLNYQNFNHLGTQYRIVKITKQTYSHYYPLVRDSINYFHQEIDWEGMFNMNDAYKRLEKGMIMYVGMMDADVFGYCWFDNFNDGKILFNLFVRNNVTPKNYTGKEFVSDILYRFEYDKTVYCEIDEWNEKSIKLFEKLGFVRY